MRRLEDIWEEVEKAPIRMQQDTYGKYVIFEGVKIQRLKSGEIKILNTRTKDEYYTHVDALQLLRFLRRGIYYGAYMLTLDVLEEKLEHFNKQIQRKNIRGYNMDKKKARRAEVMAKIKETYDKLKLLTKTTTP
jgi:hypothetical protein